MQTNKILFITLLCATSISAFADNVTVNNYGPAQTNNPNNNPNNSSGCNNYRDNSGIKPGTYYQSNPHGGTDTVYTTGDKQPFIVDPNCNNNNTSSPVIQPYINAPGPRPGPR